MDIIKDPDTGIQAGIRYMDLRERMKKNDIPEDQLIWFSLASYNAGIGHVRDAMRLARQKVGSRMYGLVMLKSYAVTFKKGVRGQSSIRLCAWARAGTLRPVDQT